MGKVKDTATSWPPQKMDPPDSPSTLSPGPSPMEASSPWPLPPPPYSLSPLSCGGFIYHGFPPLAAPHPPPVFVPMQQTHFVPSYVSEEIASRQEKLEKYRQKRGKRNFNRPVDQGRRERACARARDGRGQFTSENKNPKNEDQEKLLQMLQQKLIRIEQELTQMRKEAAEANQSKEVMKKELEDQKSINRALLNENSVLWSSVPSDEVFSTIRPQKWSDAFRDKIDFSSIELNWTDSRHLEAARSEEADFEQRWEEMRFLAGARP